jgi:hypothetical protein
LGLNILLSTLKSHPLVWEAKCHTHTKPVKLCFLTF